MYSSMFFQKYDPRARYFDDMINQMKDAGITNHLLSRALPYRDMRTSIDFKEEKLILQHLLIPLVVFGCSLLAGSIMFTLEMCKVGHVLQ